MIPSPSETYDSRNPMEESKFELRKSTRKSVPEWFYDIEDYVFFVSPIELDERIL